MTRMTWVIALLASMQAKEPPFQLDSKSSQYWPTPNRKRGKLKKRDRK